MAGNWQLLSATRALCNECGNLVDAQIREAEGKVYLAKWCPDHGLTQALVSSDAEWYRDSRSYVKPATRPAGLAVEAQGGCPESCGLCPAHQQHTCVPILEITSACDMDCPVCLVDGKTPAAISVEEVNRILDSLLEFEPTVNMLTLSGGEPTSHPDFLEIVDCCLRPEIGVVSVSTNGLRLASDDQLLLALRDRGVVVSLQFDGVRPETYEALRGDGGLARQKLDFIEKALGLGLKLSLTATIGKGINEGEVTEILKLLFSRDNILSVMFQPLAYTKQSGDPMDVVTIPDVVRLAAEGSGGVLRKEDFTPLPCSHPSCFALTYLLKTTDGGLVSLPSFIDADNYLDVIKNQAIFGADMDALHRVKDALYSLWSSDGVIPNRDAVLKTVKAILKDLNSLGPRPSHARVLDVGMDRVKSIFIHHFMDRATFDLSRAVKCCNHYPQADGRLIPACVRNNLSWDQPKTMAAT